MKKIFKFTLDRETKEIVKKETKNDKGETVTTEKEIVKTTKQKVFLKKPTRSLFDGAELFYGVRLSEGIKAGLLTRALLAKRFSNDGGVLSEDDKSRYSDLYIKLYEKQLDIERMSSTPAKKRTKDESAKLNEALEDSAGLRQELTDFEMAQSSLFEQTAENRARNKTILWWTLNLSFLEDEDGNAQAVFEGDNHDDKLASYDILEESDDEFHDELLRKLVYYVSFWYVGRVTSQEEFEKLLKDAGEEESPEEGANPEKKEAPKEAPKEEVKEAPKEAPKEEVKEAPKEEAKQEPHKNPVQKEEHEHKKEEFAGEKSKQGSKGE